MIIVHKYNGRCLAGLLRFGRHSFPWRDLLFVSTLMNWSRSLPFLEISLTIWQHQRCCSSERTQAYKYCVSTLPFISSISTPCLFSRAPLVILISLGDVTLLHPIGVLLLPVLPSLMCQHRILNKSWILRPMILRGHNSVSSRRIGRSESSSEC